MKLRRIQANSPELEQYIKSNQADLQQFEEQVAHIAADIKKRGDQVIFELTRKYDGAAIDHCINWRFNPASDARGKPVRCLIYIPVRVER